jgi:hypothetical protein
VGLPARHPALEHFQAIFKGGSWVDKTFPVALCPDGEALSLDAKLISAAGGLPTYFFTKNKKYGITSGTVMDKYSFDSSKAQLLPRGVLDVIPDGGYWE